jgi:hypothetical protein
MMPVVNDESLAALIDAGFAFLCEQKLARLIDGERLLAAIDAAATEPRVARLIQRFVAPARARVLDRLRASELTLSVWLPAPVRDGLAALLGAPMRLPRQLVDELVADERVRDSVRAMLQEALSGVIQKTFAVAPGGKSLKGVLGFGARAAGAAGRGLLGGLGEELQRQLEERVRDFVDGGVQMMQVRIAQKLASEETAQAIGQRRRRAFVELLKRRESEAAQLTDRVPHQLLDGLMPSIVAHNLARPELRAALRAEVEAAVAELSQQTLGELLDELGLREQVQDGLRAHGLALARDFIASQQFARWSAR